MLIIQSANVYVQYLNSFEGIRMLFRLLECKLMTVDVVWSKAACAYSLLVEQKVIGLLEYEAGSSNVLVQ